MINITQLQTNLETEIQNLTGSESAAAILTLTAALNNLTTNRFVSVQNYADLPNLTTNPLPSGSLILVKQFNIMMMSVGTQWRGIDGRVYVPPVNAYAWGNGGNGRLGDNTGTGKSSPVTVVGGITTWSQVSASVEHSLGLTNTGIAYAWGYNSGGRLGDGTTTNRSSPVTVIGNIANWSQVSAGYGHSLGLTGEGILYAWGRNAYGELGTNNTSSRSSPVTVVGNITNWTLISAGDRRSTNLAVTASGIAYGWGRNQYAQIGDNTTSSRSSPVTVVGGIANWSKIVAGSYHSLGSTSSGILYAWGRNTFGALGDNTETNRSSPVTVVGNITNWTQVTTGSLTSLGLTNSGVIYGWGNNTGGRIGDGTTTNRSSPVTIIGGITNWSQVSAGESHSLGLTSTGVVYGWGYGTDGRLGDGSTSSRISPVTTIGGITGWSQISAGIAHTLALKTG